MKNTLTIRVIEQNGQVTEKIIDREIMNDGVDSVMPNEKRQEQTT